MDTIVTPGLVLKETRYKESDRIITLLTPGLGVISASAQSSLRLKSKLFSACGLFCYSEFVLVPGRNMYTVREADVKNVFHGISSSIEGMPSAVASAMMWMPRERSNVPTMGRIRPFLMRLSKFSRVKQVRKVA